MVVKDTNDIMDHLRRIKNGGGLGFAMTDQIDSLDMELRFLRTFIKFRRLDFFQLGRQNDSKSLPHRGNPSVGFSWRKHSEL